MKIPESIEFSKESKKLPSFEFTIFFGQHLLEEDIPQDFIEAFKECDVYIIELIGGDAYIEELNKLSMGEIDLNSTEISHYPNPFMRKLVGLIYNSHKKNYHHRFTRGASHIPKNTRTIQTRKNNFI
jgi:hypothetical protein